jgi:hypothetical protein
MDTKTRMSHFVVWEKVTDVSEELAVSIFTEVWRKEMEDTDITFVGKNLKCGISGVGLSEWTLNNWLMSRVDRMVMRETLSASVYKPSRHKIVSADPH